MAAVCTCGRRHQLASWTTVFLAVLIFACPTVQSQERVGNDIASIRNTATFCTNDSVSGLTVTSLQSPGSVTVSWTPLPPPPSSEVTGYQIIYRPISTTMVQFRNLSDLLTSQVNLTDLQDSSTYEFYIRLLCSPTGVGPLSGDVNLTLVDALPEGRVGGVSATLRNNVVTIKWNPLPESQWNGIPRGYFIYLYRQVDDELPFAYHPVAYPRTNYTIGLVRGTYFVGVVAINSRGFSENESDRIKVVVDSGTSGGGGNPQDVQVLDYPWVYILIPGVILVVIIVVITLVLFKKVHENKKRTVTYCRDIEEKMYNGGYNNIIPMNNLSSPVTSTSLSIPNSSPGATSTVPQTNFLANRPLPNSPPLSDVSPTFVEDIPQFGNGLPSNARPERKMPHPGGLPSLGEAREPDFAIQMQRTNTSQSSVFAPTGASVVPAHHAGGQRPRNRAQTVGGIPSPYEVPEQNGNTLPRGDRPSTAHATHHGNVFQVGASSAIPPPPAHSPPPLTHSSMEIRARMGDDVFSPTGQHTLPRSMGSSRSYSVTSSGSGGRGGGAGGGTSMRHMKSDGHLPHLPLLETHEEKMVYIQPPLDSSAEASIHSAGSYGHGREEVGGVVVGGDRRVSPHNQQPHPHQHRRFQGQPPMRQPNPYTAESESFSEMTSEAGSIVSGAAPRMPVHHHHAPSYNRERSNQSHGRESVFSETSTELSVSSASEKEMSPTGWDHRGTTSEVGVGFRHHGDTSPVDREAYSDVGTPGQLPAHSQRVYKQV